MKKFIPLYLVILLFISLGNLHAADSYTLIDLGTMGNDFSYAVAINDNCIVVGNTGNSLPFVRSAFKWMPNSGTCIGSRIPHGRYSILPVDDDCVTSGASSINNLNEIAGSQDLLTDVYPSIWYSDGSFEIPLHSRTTARDINNNSQVVIGSESFGDSTILWEEGASEEIISPEWEGFSHSLPFAINDFRQIVGLAIAHGPEDYRFAFLWKDDVIYDINDFIIAAAPHVELIRARDINNLEQIIADDHSNSYLVHRDLILDLGITATAINDLGQIVGSHFLYESVVLSDTLDGHLYDLNKLIKNSVRLMCREIYPAGYPRCAAMDIEYTELQVVDINNSGQIVGSAVIGGERHAVLLVPDAPRLWP